MLILPAYTKSLESSASVPECRAATPAGFSATGETPQVAQRTRRLARAPRKASARNAGKRYSFTNSFFKPQTKKSRKRDFFSLSGFFSCSYLTDFIRKHLLGLGDIHCVPHFIQRLANLHDGFLQHIRSGVTHMSDTERFACQMCQ